MSTPLRMLPFETAPAKFIVPCGKRERKEKGQQKQEPVREAPAPTEHPKQKQKQKEETDREAPAPT